MVTPYFGYGRQDRKDEGRVPITAKLVANIITAAGANRVLALDLHAAQIQGFFDLPVDHLSATPVFVEYLYLTDHHGLLEHHHFSMVSDPHVRCHLHVDVS